MSSTQLVCLVCNRNTDQTPLLALRYQESDLWICPQHLPILIHKPHELADRLPNLDLAGPPDAHHHDH
jgi:hypothetical protein